MTTGEELAERFMEASGALIAAVEACDETEWRAMCAGEQQPVGVVARHVAASEPIVLGWVQSIVSGQGMPPVTPELIDQSNVRHAQKHADPAKAEVLALLRRNGAAVAEGLRALTDEQLERRTTTAYTGSQREVSARQIVEVNLIAHARSHLEGIQAALKG